MKRIFRFFIAGMLLPAFAFALFGCSTEIPTDEEVSAYLENTYGVTAFEIVDRGYDTASFDGSTYNRGYVAVNIQGIEIKVTNVDFGARSDNYWSIVREENDLGEYVAEKYGPLPDGVSIAANWSHYMSKPGHFPVSFEELAENSEISVTYICADAQTMINELETLVSMRESANIAERAQFRLGTQDSYRFSSDYYVLKNGKIVCLEQFPRGERQPGVEYPYGDDGKLSELRAAGAEQSEINKREDEIERELDKIGYQ